MLKTHVKGRWAAVLGLTLGLVISGLSISDKGVSTKSAQAQGSGDLVVAPTRVVFEGRSRSAQLGLVNRGSATATYRISVINMKMDQEGQLTEIAKPEEGQQFAGNLFRYSPRQVTLEPGASQAIRILLRKPKDLPQGEYRSHMMMRAVPNLEGASVERAANEASITLVPVFGIAVPVIVRHGDVDYGVAIDDLAYVAGKADGELNKLRFKLNRTGNRSAFGDLKVTVKDGDQEIVLSQILRLAVYTPNVSRNVDMVLRVPDGMNVSGKEATVTYATIPDEGGKTLSQSTIKLP